MLSIVRLDYYFDNAMFIIKCALFILEMPNRLTEYKGIDVSNSHAFLIYMVDFYKNFKITIFS